MLRTLRNLALATAILTTATAAAQSAVAIDTPTKLYRAKPGAVLNYTLQVYNPSPDPVRVRVSVGDWTLKPDGQPVFLEPGSLPQSAAGWVTFTPSTFELKGKERREVRYTLRVPEDAEPGSHWTALFLLAENPAPAPGKKLAAFRIRVAHTIYVNVPPLAHGGAILGLSATPPEDPAKPVVVAVQYANTGNAAHAVTGRIEVRNARGETVGRLEVDRTVVLPGSTRVLLARFFGPVPPGDYAVLAVLNYGDPATDVAGQTVFRLEKGLVASDSGSRER